MIEIDINNQLTEEYSTDASKKKKNWKGGMKITEGNYNGAEGTNGKNLRQNIKKVIDQGYRKYHRRQNKIRIK